MEDNLRLVCLIPVSIRASFSEASMRAAQSLSPNLIGVEVALSKGGRESCERRVGGGGGISAEEDTDDMVGGDAIAPGGVLVAP